MHAEYNASRAIAILVTTALLLNAMMPTLAYAATYLQGAEVNANTLVRYAYVAVTYYDSKGEQKLEKGWIDAIGETSFTIRGGGFRGKKTITYDKVLSVIMNDELTAPVKRKGDIKTRPTVARKIGTGLLTGGLGSILGGFTGVVISDDNCSVPCLGEFVLGIAIGYAIGVPIGVSMVDPSDKFLNTMLGSLLGAGAGIAITRANHELLIATFIFPLIGATIMSEQSRDTYEARRFSVGLAPNSDGKLSAIATLRF